RGMHRAFDPVGGAHGLAVDAGEPPPIGFEAEHAVGGTQRLERRREGHHGEIGNEEKDDRTPESWLRGQVRLPRARLAREMSLRAKRNQEKALLSMVCPVAHEAMRWPGYMQKETAPAASRSGLQAKDGCGFAVLVEDETVTRSGQGPGLSGHRQAETAALQFGRQVGLATAAEKAGDKLHFRSPCKQAVLHTEHPSRGGVGVLV